MMHEMNEYLVHAQSVNYHCGQSTQTHFFLCTEKSVCPDPHRLGTLYNLRHEYSSRHANIKNYELALLCFSFFFKYYTLFLLHIYLDILYEYPNIFIKVVLGVTGETVTRLWFLTEEKVSRCIFRLFRPFKLTWNLVFLSFWNRLWQAILCQSQYVFSLNT